MRITNIMFSRRRRGVSTILGTIIFIGIMFTSVIPMMLVMKQADTIYTQRVHEMESRDDERSSEIIAVDAYPVTNNSDQLNVKVTNTGVVPVNIVRVWIKDEQHNESTIVKSGETSEIGPYSVTLENNTSYSIKVTTDRGKSVASTCGTLYFNDGYWFTPSIGIHVLVLQDVGKYTIRVYNGSSASPDWESLDPYLTQGTDFGEIQWTEIGMTTGGYYYVEVKKKKGGSYQHVPGTPVPVFLQWPGGSPVINVVVDATDF